ncbi:MAG: hypothetical protein JW954_07570 [Dehalococcoidaceae bacterium]|nr:hypothetical protein [Dehalococcoidaceae bacterium]
MQKQTIKISENKHCTENENRIIDWPLTAAISGAVCLTATLIWGIAAALGL